MSERRPLQPASVREGYLDGGCYHFALALHRLTGLPMVEIGNMSPADTFFGGHAAIRLPDHSVVDAAGRWTGEAILEEWQANAILPMVADQLILDLCGEEDGDGGAKLSGEALERVILAEAHIRADRDYLEANLKVLPGPRDCPDGTRVAESSGCFPGRR
jgi:hypothetical protein